MEFPLKLSTSRKGVSLLISLAFTLGEAWGLGTGDYKTREIIHFYTLSIVFFDRGDWIRG